MMIKEERKIFKEFADRVHERFSYARVWAFGSRARGKATWESDFDMFKEYSRWLHDAFDLKGIPIMLQNITLCRKMPKAL